MTKFTVSPPCGGFSCQFGSVAPDENGVFDIDNGNIVAAMQEHGMTLTEVPEPPVDPKADGSDKTGSGKKAPAKTET